MASDHHYLHASLEDLNNEEPINALAVAPESGDDFDACNDETFGDSATLDEDWEQQHEQLASIVSGLSPDKQKVINKPVNQLTYIVESEHDETGWNPFSLDGFAFNIKPNMCLNDSNSKLAAPIYHGKLGSGDSLLPNQHPHPSLQSKLPRGFNGEPVKPMTLDELEKLLLSDNNSREGGGNNLIEPATKPENPLNKFFSVLNLESDNKQEKKNLISESINRHGPVVPASVQKKVQPPIYHSPTPILAGFRPFNHQFNPPLPTLPLMPVPSFLSGRIRDPSLIHMQQFQQFQRRSPHGRRPFAYRSGAFYPNQERNEDEYAGLMTQSNKEWLLKILNTALNFANPYKEDFYYVSFKAKQLTEAAKAKKKDDGSLTPSVIIPERKVDESTSAEYVPLQFEGSLGKIQVANVKCPRKLLDVDFKSKIVDPSQDRPTTPVGRAELNAFRRLLLSIEHLYTVMLEIDEVDKKMGGLPEDQRTPYVDKRRELCNQLFKGIYDKQNNDINRKIASVRKGFSLIVRSLQVLSDLNQKAAILESLKISP